MHRQESYGVLESELNDDLLKYHCENIRRKGYTILEGAVPKADLDELQHKFELVFAKYQELFDIEELKASDEHNGFRMPFFFDKFFLKLVTNDKVLSIVNELMGYNFVLNQQNAISNPGGEKYNQSKWHRDLPYSHYVSSRPLMINALFCLDDFTLANGATRVIPGSHLFEKFPSEKYIDENTSIAEAPSGSFIILDSMLFHSGTSNKTSKPRRAINNVYSSPHIKQQINITTENTEHLKLTEFESRLLGVNFKDYSSVEGYLISRKVKP